jgi:peptide/nickel transport system ATP-binding protein
MGRYRDADVAIRCTDLSITRAGGRTTRSDRVVDGVDLSLPHGGTLAVLGPTGAGKSSLAAVLAGVGGDVLSVAGGDAWVEGISVRRPGRARRELVYRVGFLAQGEAARLPSRLTVEEIIASPVTSRDRRVNKRALAIRVVSLLDELKLPLGMSVRYPYELSAGMRQRVAFARSLMLDPKVLVADDLFANLDVQARQAVVDALVRRRSGHGMSTLLVGNDRDGVDALDAEVLVLRGGHVVAYGRRPDDVVWTPGMQDGDQLRAS